MQLMDIKYDNIQQPNKHSKKISSYFCYLINKKNLQLLVKEERSNTIVDRCFQIGSLKIQDLEKQDQIISLE